MTLRNVPKAHTLEQQRQEINLIATDLNTAIDGVQTFGGDKEFTGDITFSGSGGASFGDNSDLKIYYDGSVGVETSFIDSDALQIRSATDTSELYATFLKDGPVELYYDGTKRFGTNSTGATVLGDLNVSSNLTFDTAGSHIEFTPSSWSGSAPYMEFWVGNNSGTHYAQIDGGNAGQLQIMNTGHPNGHLDLRTAKDFSVDCGGYYAILAQATGATKIWHPVSQEDILSPKFETTATGAKVNGFFESSLLVNTNNTPTAGEGIEMFYDSAASGGAAGSIQAYDRDNNALTRLKIRSSNWEILNDGTATLGAFDQSSASGNGTIISHDGQVTVQRPSGSSSYLFRGFQGTTEKYFVKADGSAMFDGGIASKQEVYVQGTTTSTQRYLNFQDAGTSNYRATLRRDAWYLGSPVTNIGDVTPSGANIVLNMDGSATFAGGDFEINETGNANGKVNIDSTSDGGNSAWGLYVKNNDSRSGRPALKLQNVGDANAVEILSADGTAVTTTITSNGGVQLNNPSGDTSLSIGDTTNTEGRLILTSKSNTVEIHSRSNHPIDFLFNTTTKATLGINGDLSLAGGLSFSSQTNSSTGNSVSVTATGFDHYEQGTFTPYFGFGLTSPSYTYAGGDYIRIGNIVHFYITISATGTNNGDAIQILGLPYPTAGTDGGSASFAYNTGMVVNGDTMPNIYISNAGRILFYDPGSGNSWTGNSGNGLSGAQLYIGGHYICA